MRFIKNKKLDMNDLEKFDNWNEIKKNIHIKKQKELYVNKKEIWYIHKGVNIGFESNGKGEDFRRPVLVIKKVGSLFFVVSMTTKGKDNNFYYKLDDSYFGEDSFIILSQVLIVDKNRFMDQIGEISQTDFEKIKKELKNILF